MKRNIGSIERVIRVVVGIVMIGLSITGFLDFWGWLGILVLASGLVGWCWAYQLLGVSTCKVQK
jgi:hypothetical protein